MHASLRRSLPALALVFLATACHRGATISPQTNFDYLSQAQMQERNFINLHDAIAALRGNWLVVRGTDSFQAPSQIWVYYDQTKLGGIETLKTVLVQDIAYARHYSAIDATTRWGVGHAAGVIYVSSHQ